MAKELFKAFFRSLRGAPFTVTFWDGQSETFGLSGRETPSFKIILRESLNLRSMLGEPEVSFGEAYMDGKIEVEGDFRRLFKLLIDNRSFICGEGETFLKRLKKSCAETSPERRAEEARRHYELGNDFFRLWLDRTMSYTCAYFHDPTDSLEQAQVHKIDHILRKLSIVPGESLLDIGSGWGWLIVRAAREYGARALGITLSDEQETETVRRIEEEKVQALASVRQADYRDLAVEGGLFDKIVSVGMFKHVGKEYIPCFFACLEKMLQPRGLVLLQTMARPREAPPHPWLDKHIFPWSYIPSLREIIWELPEHSFHLLDVESLRPHYALTLEHWVENFEAAAETIEAQYGSRFVRMWRIYLHGCSAAIESGNLDAYQLLFSKNQGSAVWPGRAGS